MADQRIGIHLRAQFLQLMRVIMIPRMTLGIQPLICLTEMIGLMYRLLRARMILQELHLALHHLIQQQAYQCVEV